ncbi:MAG: hypothetical protein AAB364_00645 [Patescibacteria group bacterium]
MFNSEGLPERLSGDRYRAFFRGQHPLLVALFKKRQTTKGCTQFPRPGQEVSWPLRLEVIYEQDNDGWTSIKRVVLLLPVDEGQGRPPHRATLYDHTRQPDAEQHGRKYFYLYEEAVRELLLDALTSFARDREGVALSRLALHPERIPTEPTEGEGGDDEEALVVDRALHVEETGVNTHEVRAQIH